MSTEFGIGKGITITTGFDVATQKPLDSRTVVKDLDELSNMPAGMIYLGLTVFVISENKLYQRKYEVDEDGIYIFDENGNHVEVWGPIESEISSKDIESLDEIDFNDTPIYMLQKNKKDFFPMVHEDSVFVEKDGQVMKDKYQTIVDQSLKTLNKTIPGAINEVNDYLDEKLAVFNDQLDEKLAEIDAQVDAANKAIETAQADLQESIENAEEELETKMTEIQTEINDRVDQMLRDVDNVILTDLECDYLMEQINMNLALLDGDGSSAVMMASFKAYNSAITIDTATTEIPLDSLGVPVTSDDKLFVHMNSVYLTEGVDYNINYTNQEIVNITDTPWNSYNIEGCEIALDLIKKSII